MINEAAISKALFNTLYQKWSPDKPEITREEIEQIHDDFRKFQSALKPTHPAVKSFLYRYSGNYGYSKFDPRFITDITKYTYDQITSLIGEFKDEVGQDINIGDAFKGYPRPTQELIDKSKELWYNPNTAIINENGFRVYKITDQGMSMAYGYYQQVIARELGGSQWCVTWRPDSGGTNQWENYRTAHQRSFYFVIDESKQNTDKKYFISALQTAPTSSGKYVITPAPNVDEYMTWEKVLSIYPKLAPYKDLIRPVTFDDNELKIRDLASKINETEGSRTEFIRLDRKYKKYFINNGGILRKPISWDYMDEGLRSLYISTTTRDNAMEKFSNFDFISEIKKVGNQFTQLNNRFKDLGFEDGIGYVMTSLLSNKYRLRRVSNENPQIKIYEDLSSQKLCGVWHDRYGDWLKYEGVTYNDRFKDCGAKVIKIKENKEVFFVEKLCAGGDEFYSLYSINDKNKKKGHFISAKKWEEFMSDAQFDERNNPQKEKFDPETDIDIKELKKGV